MQRLRLKDIEYLEYVTISVDHLGHSACIHVMAPSVYVNPERLSFYVDSVEQSVYVDYVKQSVYV